MGRLAQTIAPAKVNLYLGVHTERDSRGYHRADSLMCALDLYDEVSVELPEAGGGGAGRRGEPDGLIELACEPQATKDPRDNLAWRAAHGLSLALDRAEPIRIHLRKRVPSQAGLGGGSSDAAAVLRCLAALWDVHDDDLLARVARGLGADVAFFLQDRPCLLGGGGDVALETFGAMPLTFALARPPEGVSTAKAYQVFDQLATPVAPLGPLLDALRAGDVAATRAHLSNNLEPAACVVQPLVALTLETLGQAASRIPGAGPALLCGSGSCCALLVPDDQAAGRVRQGVCEPGWWGATAHALTEPWGRPRLA